MTKFLAGVMGYLLVFLLPVSAQLALEELIQHRLAHYGFSPENQFRLAAYAELKGDYTHAYDVLELRFGDQASMSFYRQHCLLWTADFHAHKLEKYRENPIALHAINQELDSLFGQISLFHHKGANPEKVRFIDQNLARKNIEPFIKIYLRHLFIRYGEYHPAAGKVELQAYKFEHASLDNSEAPFQSKEPLMLKLDKLALRGFYLNSGGVVYVTDVKRKVWYATGEDYGANVTAFKVFIEKWLSRTITYVVRTTPPITQQARNKAPATQPRLASPYSHYDWIPMMLNLLRANGVNIGDSDVICYFVDQPYYERIYRQLNSKERALADQYRLNLK